jgi:hypothetical protein
VGSFDVSQTYGSPRPVTGIASSFILSIILSVGSETGSVTHGYERRLTISGILKGIFGLTVETVAGRRRQLCKLKHRLPLPRTFVVVVVVIIIIIIVIFFFFFFMD